MFNASQDVKIYPVLLFIEQNKQFEDLLWASENSGINVKNWFRN